MGKIHAYVKAPWIPPVKISIPQSKVEEIQQTTSHQGPAAFTDSSSRNDLVGIGVHWQNLNLPVISIAISSPQYLSVYSGELAAIDASTTYLYYLAQHAGLPSFTTVFTDFFSTLQALQALGQQSAQSLPQSIIYQVYRIETSFLNPFKIQFACAQAILMSLATKSLISLLKRAPKKETQSSSTNTHPGLLQTVAFSSALASFLFLSIPDRQTPKPTNLQKALIKLQPPLSTPDPYTTENQNTKQLFCASYTQEFVGTIGAAPSTECMCEKGVETVDHFLFRCSLWSDLRQEIRRIAGPRWGDTSYLLGGWSGTWKDGPFDKWKPNIEMINATIRLTLSTSRLDDKRDEPLAQT